MSNRLGVHRGVSVPRSSSTLHSRIGSTSVGRLAHTACVTQSLDPPGRRCRVFIRTQTWGRWHLGHVHVLFHMVGSKDRSRVALGKGSCAPVLLGSTPRRCARHWLLLWEWKSVLCHEASLVTGLGGIFAADPSEDHFVIPVEGRMLSWRAADFRCCGAGSRHRSVSQCSRSHRATSMLAVGPVEGHTWEAWCMFGWNRAELQHSAAVFRVMSSVLGRGSARGSHALLQLPL